MEREARVGTVGHFVPSPMPSQRSMIESIIKPVGDHLWQRGTSCGGVSCPGGTSCSATSSLGGPSMVAATGPGGPILGGLVVT